MMKVRTNFRDGAELTFTVDKSITVEDFRVLISGFNGSGLRSFKIVEG